ncbi:protein kinase domain-containing protein, partial [Haematococcus lacustris]
MSLQPSATRSIVAKEGSFCFRLAEPGGSLAAPPPKGRGRSFESCGSTRSMASTPSGCSEPLQDIASSPDRPLLQPLPPLPPSTQASIGSAAGDMALSTHYAGNSNNSSLSRSVIEVEEELSATQPPTTLLRTLASNTSQRHRMSHMGMLPGVPEDSCKAASSIGSEPSLLPTASRAASIRNSQNQRQVLGMRASHAQSSMRSQVFAAASKGTRLMNTSGRADSLECDLEDAVIGNRRRLDAQKTLLEEIKIDKVLGFGSMGVVYFGMLWDARVVVKTIEHSTGVLGKQQNRSKLARSEAAVSRLLLHPNIVLTYECSTGNLDASKLKVSGLPGKQQPLNARPGRMKMMTLMVQEFCEMGTLRDALLKRKFGLDPDMPDFHHKVLHLALDIANGMKYIHGLRILHCDLKAENVLLQHPGASPGAIPSATSGSIGMVAKVADFGLVM